MKSHQKISDTAGGFAGTLNNIDRFGNALASLGDLDGDGIGDLAVGARLDDDGALNGNRGAVFYPPLLHGVPYQIGLLRSFPYI